MYLALPKELLCSFSSMIFFISSNVTFYQKKKEEKDRNYEEDFL